jgi:type IV pilus assembly protein PilO
MNFLEELRALDVNEPGRWPLAFRLGAVGLVLVIVTALGIWQFVVKDEIPELEVARNDEVGLRQSFESKQRKAANFNDFLNQLETIERDFGTMLGQLPGQAEVANLVDDISQTALAAGLDPRVFEPGAEVSRDFYAETPIELRYLGSYHELARFVSDIAALSRIVTLHDIRITPNSDEDGGDTEEELRLDVTAKTYHYIGEDSE